MRPAPPDEVPDLVEGDEVGDLSLDRRDRDLQTPAAPADRPAPLRGARELDPVLGAELLDVRLHMRPPRLSSRAEGSRECGHTWAMPEAPTNCAWRSPRSTPPSATSTATPRLASEAITSAREAGAQLVRPARALPVGIPARGPGAARRLPRCDRRGARRARGRHRRHHGAGRLPRAHRAPRGPHPQPDHRPGRPARLQLARRLRRRRGHGRLPQEPSAELRASSTSAATSSRAPSRWSCDVAGVPVGLTICEDIWVQGSPEADEAAQAPG